MVPKGHRTGRFILTRLRPLPANASFSAESAGTVATTAMSRPRHCTTFCQQRKMGKRRNDVGQYPETPVSAGILSRTKPRFQWLLQLLRRDAYPNDWHASKRIGRLPQSLFIALLKLRA